MDLIAALEVILRLKKNYRDNLISISSDKELSSYLEKVLKISAIKETVLSFKAVIPTVYSLVNYINKIDSELNIYDVHTENKGTWLKQYRNIPNFSTAMKNFDRADLWIEFVRNKSKVIALRINDSWQSPSLDIPNSVPTNKVLKTFDKFLEGLKGFQTEQVKQALKIDQPITYHKTYENLEIVQYNKRYWNFSLENCCEIFENIYGFDPRQSNNNGLYTLILECDSRYFPATNVPIHELENIESNLNKAGIKKSIKRPNLTIKYLKKKTPTEFQFALYCNRVKLTEFRIKQEFNQLIQLN